MFDLRGSLGYAEYRGQPEQYYTFPSPSLPAVLKNVEYLGTGLLETRPSLCAIQRNSFLETSFQPCSYPAALVTTKEMTFLLPFPNTFVFLVTGWDWILNVEIAEIWSCLHPSLHPLPVPSRATSGILPLRAFLWVLRYPGGS